MFFNKILILFDVVGQKNYVEERNYIMNIEQLG